MKIKNILCIAAILVTASFQATAQRLILDGVFFPPYHEAFIDDTLEPYSCGNPNPYLPYPDECVTLGKSSLDSTFHQSDILEEFTKETSLGKMHVVTMVSTHLKKASFVFKSKATNEMISATVEVPRYIKEKLDTYTISLNLPKGNLIIDEKYITILTENDSSQILLSDYQKGYIDDKHFISLMKIVINDFAVADFIITIDDMLAQKGFWGCLGGLVAVIGGAAIIGTAITVIPVAGVVISGAGAAQAGLLINSGIDMVQRECGGD